MICITALLKKHSRNSWKGGTKMGAASLDINEYLDDRTLQDIELNLVNFAQSWQQNGSDPEALEQSRRADIDSQIGYDDDETPEEYTQEPANMDESMERLHSYRQSIRATERERTPITPQNLQDAMGRPTANNVTNRTEAFENAERDAINRTDWAEQEMNITAGRAKIGKRNLDYSLVRNPVGWGEELSDDPSKVLDNLETVKSRISSDIYSQFGGWSRITNLVVLDNQLIINNVMYVPLIEPQYINRLPLDVSDYICCGHLAPLFDWKYLRKMSHLTTFVCDDPTFYVTYIADDLGLGRRIGASSLFKVCGRLSLLRIGNDEITRDKLYTKESVNIKKAVNKQKRFQNIGDMIGTKIYSCTGKLASSGWHSLKDYATHKGNKGMPEYLVGIAVRTVGLGIKSVPHVAAHIVGGFFAACKETFSDCKDLYERS